MECPVSVVIKEIRGGNIVSTETDDTYLIKIGGNEFVFDDINGYIISRKIELARFELSMPDLNTCQEKFQQIINRMLVTTTCECDCDENHCNCNKEDNDDSCECDCNYNSYGALYKKIMIQSGFIGHKYIFTQFSQLIKIIKDIEKLVCYRARLAAKNNTSINISCNTLPFDTDAQILYTAIMYDPQLLNKVTNLTIDYLNKLEVNSIANQPARDMISHVDNFTASLDFNTEITIPDINEETPAAYLSAMHTLLNIDMLVAQYALEVEKYHCRVINHLNLAYDKCHKII